ncbi:hypothetical protein FHG87_010201 [Trinorchestia longiramus]|nr:hypothetical protein FHG87_010201 [Trinorchestia longiramus]
MKLQLLLLGCLIALFSGLGVEKSSRKASGLSSSSRTNRHGISSRDDDYYKCDEETCYECDDDDRCSYRRPCDDDEICIGGRCCEHEGGRCSSDGDCYYNDDGDDDDDDDD